MRRLLAASLVAIAVVFMAAVAFATVSTSTRSVTYSPGSPTTSFAVTFPFIGADALRVTKITIASGAETTLTRGTDYTVTLPVGSTQGSVTTTASVTSTHQLRIDRVTPLTQTTNFRTQGSFSPASHENAFDKLTMMVQETRAAAGTSGDSAVSTHVGLSDPHTQYTKLTGRSGGQHTQGDTASGGNYQISSTAHATKGKVLIGSGGTELVVDDANNNVGIGTASPNTAFKLDVDGDVLLGDSTALLLGSEYIASASDGTSTYLNISAANADYTLTNAGQIFVYGPSHSTKPAHMELAATTLKVLAPGIGGATRWTFDSSGITGAAGYDLTLSSTSYLQTPTIQGSAASGGDLQILSTTDATKGDILLGSGGTELVVDDVNNRVGVGTATPSTTFHVVGTTTLGTPLGIASGGTNASTQTTAFDNLAPTTTAGDIIYSNGSDNVRLAIGSAYQTLKTNPGATAPAWAFDTFAVRLGNDVADSSGASTYTDCTGLSFAVSSGITYGFRAQIFYTAAATTTGSAWAMSGPASSALAYRSNYSLTTASETTNHTVVAYDSPAAANATSADTAGNIAVIEGFVTPSASGTMIVRFATEVAGSAITCKAGSVIEWWASS